MEYINIHPKDDVEHFTRLFLPLVQTAYTVYQVYVVKQTHFFQLIQLLLNIIGGCTNLINLRGNRKTLGDGEGNSAEKVHRGKKYNFFNSTFENTHGFGGRKDAGERDRSI